jgi:hypothetical protein
LPFVRIKGGGAATSGRKTGMNGKQKSVGENAKWWSRPKNGFQPGNLPIVKTQSKGKQGKIP